MHNQNSAKTSAEILRIAESCSRLSSTLKSIPIGSSIRKFRHSRSRTAPRASVERIFKVAPEPRASIWPGCIIVVGMD